MNTNKKQWDGVTFDRPIVLDSVVRYFDPDAPTLFKYRPQNNESDFNGSHCISGKLKVPTVCPECGKNLILVKEDVYLGKKEATVFFVDCPSGDNHAYGPHGKNRSFREYNKTFTGTKPMKNKQKNTENGNTENSGESDESEDQKTEDQKTEDQKTEESKGHKEKSETEAAEIVIKAFESLKGGSTDKAKELIGETNEDKLLEMLYLRRSTADKNRFMVLMSRLHKDADVVFGNYTPDKSPWTDKESFDSAKGQWGYEESLEQFNAKGDRALDVTAVDPSNKYNVNHKLLAKFAAVNIVKTMDKQLKKAEEDLKSTKNKNPEHPQQAEILKFIKAGINNVFLVGPAGTGKTTMAEKIAQHLKKDFALVTLSKTTPPEKLFGYIGITNGETKYQESEFVRVMKSGGVVCLDEFDNANPNTLVEINAALANGLMSTPNGIIHRHKDSIVIACGNTFGYGPSRQFVGRQALDVATLDRFMVFTINYVPSFERTFIGGNDDLWKTVVDLRNKINSSGIIRTMGARSVMRLKTIMDVKGLDAKQAFKFLTGPDCEAWKDDELQRIGYK